MTWYCTNCGSNDLRAVQPSADASGRTATAVCHNCTRPRADAVGIKQAWPRGGAVQERPLVKPYRASKRAREAKSAPLWESEVPSDPD